MFDERIFHCHIFYYMVYINLKFIQKKNKMALNVGIVGLPNVGKSTIFNALTIKKVPAENYPFCTIEPNQGIVAVPDSRLLQIDAIAHSSKIVPSIIEFIDIAGLVKGAAVGEGLGNKFLSHIREVDAILHVVRAFQDDEIIHVEGRVDPKDDIAIISMELALKDLETIEKLISNELKSQKAGKKESAKRIELFEMTRELLQKDMDPNQSLTLEDKLIIKDANLLSLKPKIYVLNVSDNDLQREFDFPFPYIKVSARLEAELVDFTQDEKKEYLEMAGIEYSGLEQIIKESYKSLNLINFFTEGPDEIRSWTIQNGNTAPQAAGVIHTDFMNKFIRLEVVQYTDFIAFKGWDQAKQNGTMRSEGKEYIVKDGDIVIVRHS